MQYVILEAWKMDLA